MVKDLVLHTAATEPLLTIADVKAHCRVDHDDDDDTFEELIATATSHLDGYEGILGRALVSQVWDYHLPCFAMTGHLRRIPLPLTPLISVDQISYVDMNGEDQILSPADYVVLDGRLAAVEPQYGKTWPSTRRQSRAATIRYTCGYGAAAAVPASLRSAARLIVADLYDNRAAQTFGDGKVNISANPAVDRLIKPFRIPRT